MKKNRRFRIREKHVMNSLLESAVHLKHAHCNAQWLHMENPSDETNAFNVHFKTVPQNSTGMLSYVFLSVFSLLLCV